jgi:hypothetical protein
MKGVEWHRCFIDGSLPDEIEFMSAGKDNSGVVPTQQFYPYEKDVQTKGIDSFQPFSIDGRLGIAGEIVMQNIDKLMSRSAVKVALQLYPNQTVVFFSR